MIGGESPRLLRRAAVFCGFTGVLALAAVAGAALGGKAERPAPGLVSAETCPVSIVRCHSS